MTLSVNGKQVASGKADGCISRTSTDGLQAGQDLKDPVGDYTVPFGFKGKIDKVTVRMSGAATP